VQEDDARVPNPSMSGRSLVTRRAVIDLVRTATVGSYGVTGFAARPHERLLGRLGLAHPASPSDSATPWTSSST
jgi:hypothetical protein